MNRRELIRAAIAAPAALLSEQALAARPQDDDLARLEVVEARARQAGIEPLGTVRGSLYLAIGNADGQFAATAVRLCDALARDFLKHFGDRGFDTTKPQYRMLIVIVADPNDFASFLGENPGAAVRGIYDLDAGWLAMCDNRGGAGGPGAERANSITLFHEATHQLCFECGLLDRHADTPLAISEGLATYGETRRPDNRTAIGARNQERIAVLRTLFDRANKLRGSLIPAADLIADDALFSNNATEQLAYAQCWSLIHMLMQTPDDQAKLRAYLQAVKTRKDTRQRRSDAENHLGPAAELDARLLAYVTRLARR